MGELSRAFSCTLYVVLLFDSVYIEECCQGVGLSRNKGLSLLGVLVISFRCRFSIAMLWVWRALRPSPVLMIWFLFMFHVT